MIADRLILTWTSSCAVPTRNAEEGRTVASGAVEFFFDVDVFLPRF
jgi:hypothetical protein